MWGCNLLAHFISAYLVDDSVSDALGGWLGNDQNLGSQFSQALAIWADTKFLMGIAVSLLTSSFLLVGDFLARKDCGLQAGLPPWSPVFKSWIHLWKYLSVQGSSSKAPACFSTGCHQERGLPWGKLNHLKKQNHAVSPWPPQVRSDHLGAPVRRPPQNHLQVL